MFVSCQVKGQVITHAFLVFLVHVDIFMFIYYIESYSMLKLCGVEYGIRM